MDHPSEPSDPELGDVLKVVDVDLVVAFLKGVLELLEFYSLLEGHVRVEVHFGEADVLNVVEAVLGGQVLVLTKLFNLLCPLISQLLADTPNLTDGVLLNVLLVDVHGVAAAVVRGRDMAELLDLGPGKEALLCVLLLGILSDN